MNGQMISFNEAHGAFIARCEALNLARGSIAWYGIILRDMGAYLHRQGIHEVAGVNATTIRGYLTHLRDRGQGSETIFRRWGALKAFFRFLFREGLIAANPIAQVERPKREKHLVQPFSMLQVHALLAQPDISKPIGLRDKAMLLLMVDSGLRLSEVLGLELGSINWEDSQLVVLGKGRKERAIPVSRTVTRALEEYIQVRGAGGQRVFLGRAGRPLNSRTVQVCMRKYGKAAKIQGIRLSPHTLRHTFAIQWIKNEGDPFSLQSILGHSTLDMVRHYVNLARQDVASKHRKFSPMSVGQVNVVPASEAAPAPQMKTTAASGEEVYDLTGEAACGVSLSSLADLWGSPRGS